MWAHARFDRRFTNPFVLWSKIAGPTAEKETWLSLSASASPALLDIQVMCAGHRSAPRQINSLEVPLRSTGNNKDDRCLLVHGFIQFYLINTVTVCLFQRRS